MENKFINKILENINLNKGGVIVASPSKKDPNYFYHWIRDSAIIIRTIIKEYNLNSKEDLKTKIINYINLEMKLQNLDPLGKLGEPKFNVDGSLFNEKWGRPQNDGPALRTLAFIDIIKNNLIEEINIDKNIFINKVIYKNIIYICDNIHEPCFDLWEEIYGYHLYTRLVQAKALSEFLKIYKGKNFHIILKKYKELKILITHHINNEIISSYGKNKILRVFDTSVFLGLCHIDFDDDIVKIDLNLLSNYINEVKNFYKKKYQINDNYHFTFIGRYFNDNYYNGQIWYICTIGLLRVLNKYFNEKKDVHMFIKYISSLKDLNLSEQLEDITMNSLSAEKLTWNYSELYNLFIECK